MQHPIVEEIKEIPQAGKLPSLACRRSIKNSVSEYYFIETNIGIAPPFYGMGRIICYVEKGFFHQKTLKAESWSSGISFGW